jgi:hypothetical protein
VTFSFSNYVLHHGVSEKKKKKKKKKKRKRRKKKKKKICMAIKDTTTGI